MKKNSLLQARIVSRKQISPSLVELVFESDSGLPAAEPGSHVDVHLPNGLVRQYSLVEPVAEGSSYRIGVRVLTDGRGGSRCVAESLIEGQNITLGTPRNLFKLYPENRPIVLVAGGIGITPVHAMAEWLRAINHRDWVLHYTFSNRDNAYFPSEWMLTDDRVRLYDSSTRESQSAKVLNLNQLVSSLEMQGGGDIYCCGPTGMLEYLSAKCAQSAKIRYVQENFVASEILEGEESSAFLVTLAKSGCTIPVAADQTILEALQNNGIDVPYSCGQGICGACETTVLAGTPLHRDVILSPDEQELGETMMICCSRAQTSSLTLDL